MSLINDALKRAEQAQPPVPPTHAPPGPQLRPAEPGPSPRRGLGLAVPVALALVALLTLLLLWQMSHQVAAKSEPSPQALAADKPEAAAPAVSAPTVPEPVPTPAGSNFAPQVTSSFAADKTASITVLTNEPAKETAPPKPVLPRLQGITYNPRNPCAVIGGKTVFVGERLGQFKVTAIGRDSATLVGNGETNLLVLEP